MAPEELPEVADVLIVGAGPVGTALANLCGQLAIDTVLIDRLPEIQTDPRAIALDNEALRILQNLGLTTDAFERVAINEVTLRSPLFGLFARMNTSRLLDTHPMLVTFFQPDLERALHERLEAYEHVRCVRPVTCLSVAQDDAGCTAVLQGQDGLEHSLRARFVVAADGASSPLRRALGLPFGGSTYEQDWLIVDALDVARPIDHVDFYCDPKRPSPQMPAPGGRQRWEFMLRRNESSDAMLASDNIQQLLAERGIVDDPKIERKAVYRFHARVAEHFSLGRVFLVGDAAHVTPPFAGQGLVAGLRDVFNLAWKLAWVLQGRGDESLLNSYTIERKPHAWEMIRLAQWMGKMIMPTNRLAALLSQGSARLMMLLPPLRKKIVNLENKPQNRFARGWFIPRPRRWMANRVVYERGNHLPQVWLTSAATSVHEPRILRSDDVLGLRLQLLGVNVDPLAQLTIAQRRDWHELGGHVTAIFKPNTEAARPTIDAASDVWYDRDDALPLGPHGEPWFIVVRPDKVVITDGRVDRLADMINEFRRQLIPRGSR